MTTIVAHAHRPHAFWVRVVEDLALLSAATIVGWTLFATLALHQSPMQAIAQPIRMVRSPAPIVSVPAALVPATKPMMAAVAAATKLEERGVFTEETRAAWEKALSECRRLSVQPIAASEGTPVMLWLLEPELERAAELADRIASTDTPAGEIATLTALRDEALANAAVIERYREIINYDYWRATCEEAATPAGLAAREEAWIAGQLN